ncbi:iron complex outermembrane recepter protein [Prevotella sp. ne3005]|uniref:SusC/RagA family TonB-linked outer membrane protein n=1 Tax=Prevotella sp. ne3005 TaxID=1761887 RepID=UPI0008BEEA59|nr:TonB-dependent receptor [Prevotella sp. ne3005]SEM77794.1 iron complex outermembrane recepter protein [Prevotella sp. ne3005]
MKQVNIQVPLRMLGLLLGLFLSVGAFAQIDVKGHVKDATGEPIIGATVRVDGTQTATVTDFDGNFALKANQGADITITYIGYQPQTVKAAPTVEVILQDDAAVLNEVVVIGYGAVRKSDLTGSVTAMKPDTKNKGLVVNAQEMMQGKIAGVNVTSDGGSPGGSSTIRIRGGSSLNASNNPLIVIDGVPMDNNGVKGLSNPLSMVNPQDIESFNVLKDASATAIYGSRGSNGVIIITTKKGRKGSAPQVSYNGSVTMSMKKKLIDVMNGDQYRAFATQLYKGNAREEAAMAALGDANTDWQDEIYRTAWSHDHNVTLAGAIGNLPYRVSLGYTDQQGILKTSDFKRYTAALNLNPSLLNDHLTLNLNAKGMWAKTQYANTGAIGAAMAYDPTKPIYDTTSADAKNFGGYTEWKVPGESLNDPSWPNTYNRNATANPVALLDLNDDRAISRSFIGNADIDYKIHGFEDLRLHLTLGADISEGKQWTDVANSSPAAIYYGYHGWDKITKRNLTLSTYAQYYKDFAKVHHFDIMGGYEWQHFWRSQKTNNWGTYPSTHAEKAGEYHDWYLHNYKTENYLVSFFGRMNYILMDRYYITATLRDDGSSRFKDHWQLYPSAALAYKMSEEKVFKNIDWLSDLKLRLSYGKTGQQEGIGDYNYFAIYALNSGIGSYYDISGDGSMARPDAYDPNLKWETTDTYNIGFDFGAWNQRFTVGVDVYFRKTTDLLNKADVAAGTNFKNTVMTNIGSMENKGVEVTLGLKPIQTDDWYWTIDYNFTYNHNEITELIGDDPNYFVPTGGIGGGTGVNAQAHAVGHPAYSYYVYQQVYDKAGKPIEGQVVDRNGDGVITEADKYYYKSPMAPVTMGLSSRLEYKSWDLGFTLRASLGNYVFNNLMSGNVNMSAAELYSGGNNFYGNRPVAALDYNWQTYDLEAKLSDHWVQNGSFLKCDNITLGYSFDSLFKCGNYKGIGGRIYATASNVFCITKYDGIDPEVFGGIDNNLYPRPISFILGLNLNF